jgi:hypothetical protein
MRDDEAAPSPEDALMPRIKGLRKIGYFDCPGGGQVYVDQGYAYVGHMDGPDGTTIVDVKDPKRPRKVAHLEVPLLERI